MEVEPAAEVVGTAVGPAGTAAAVAAGGTLDSAVDGDAAGSRCCYERVAPEAAAASVAVGLHKSAERAQGVQLA